MRRAAEDFEPRLRQRGGKPARAGQRHQRVGFAVDDERRLSDRTELRAQVDAAQPVEPARQRRTVGRRLGGERFGERAGDRARLAVALVEERDEALSRRHGVLPNGGGKAVEHRGRLRRRPVGALLALQAALLAPRRVGRLVLCGATPSFVQRDGWPHAQAATLLDRFDEALADDAAATLKRFIALFNQGDRQARAITRTLSKALAAETPPDGAMLARGLDWLRRVDLRAQLSAIAQPTLLIHGENDPLMPLAAAHWLADALPDARLKVFGGAAHAPFINDPERFARLLADFCHVPASR